MMSVQSKMHRLKRQKIFQNWSSNFHRK